MEDSLNFEIPVQDAPRPVRRARASRSGAPGVDRPELQTGEPIDIYHWAAVALVTALMCAGLGYAAGTPPLTRAANVTSGGFGGMGGALVFAGLVRKLRRFAAVRVAQRRSR